MATDWTTGEPETEAKWLGKMNSYLEKNPRFAIHRAVSLACDQPYDWDDNTPKEWAVKFLRNTNYVDFVI